MSKTKGEIPEIKEELVDARSKPALAGNVMVIFLVGC